MVLAILPWRGSAAGWLEVETPAPDPQAAQLVQEMGDALTGELAGLLRGRVVPAHPLRVRLTPGTAVIPANATGLVVVGLDAPVMITAQALAHGLIRQALTDLKLARPPEGGGTGPATVPDWLAAALVAQALEDDGSPGVSPAGLRLPRLPRTSGPFPDPAALVATPVSPEFPMPYLLYGRYCLALAVVIDRGARPGQPAPFARLLELQAAGHAPAEVLLLTAARQFQPNDSLSSWAEREVGTLARRTSARLTVDEIAARINTIETFPVVIPGRGAPAGSAAAGIALDELPQAMKDGLQVDAAAMETRIHELVLLAAEAPPLMQPAIEKHMAALKALANGDTARSHRELRVARQEFAAAAERQRRIAVKLDAVAGLDSMTSALTAEHRAWELFRTLAADSRRRSQALDPALAHILDQAAAE